MGIHQEGLGLVGSTEALEKNGWIVSSECKNSHEGSGPRGVEHGKSNYISIEF